MKVAEVREVNSSIVQQVEKHRLQQGCFDKQHMCCFRKLASLPEFMGSLQPGISIASGGDVPDVMDVDDHQVDLNIDCEAGAEEEEAVWQGKWSAGDPLT